MTVYTGIRFVYMETKNIVIMYNHRNSFKKIRNSKFVLKNQDC